MSATFDSEPLDAEPGAVSMSGGTRDRHVVIAARRLSWAQAGLAVLALAVFALVFMRLLERWRVTPRAISHRIGILGQELSYPVANLAAIVVVALALLGAIVVVTVIARTTRELNSTRRFARRLAAGHQGVVKDAFVIDDARPQAFCVGLLRPQVYMTTGALAILDDEALDAVLSHERHHARRRDPLRFAASRVLARSLFFLPGLAELDRWGETLAEIYADEAAVGQAPANRSALARAMLSFADSPAAKGSVGIDHARVDYLLGEPPNWRVSTLMVVPAVFLLALLAAVTVLAGQAAAGSASLAPPFLSAQPCVVVLALIPAGLILVAIAVVRFSRLGAALLASSD
jgi:Zn-dependent protease with chaperone function